VGAFLSSVECETRGYNGTCLRIRS